MKFYFKKYFPVPPIVIALFFILITILSCTERTANLEKADSLAARGMYAQAEKELKNALIKTYSDTLQYARIRNRIKNIRRFRFFKPLDSLLRVNNWPQAFSEWQRLNRALKDSSEEVKRFYGFELFHKKSIIDSALNRANVYWDDLKEGLKFPSAKIALVRLKYETLGLHLAKQDSLEEARAMFDRSLRKIRLSKLSTAESKIYFAYMEGHFENCLRELKSLPDSLKDRHWKNLQFFLDNYGKTLTLDERFKLW